MQSSCFLHLIPFLLRIPPSPVSLPTEQPFVYLRRHLISTKRASGFATQRQTPRFRYHKLYRIFVWREVRSGDQKCFLLLLRYKPTCTPTDPPPTPHTAIKQNYMVLFVKISLFLFSFVYFFLQFLFSSLYFLLFWLLLDTLNRLSSSVNSTALPMFSPVHAHTWRCLSQDSFLFLVF